MNKGKTLIVVTGLACNNNCAMCSLACVRQGKVNRDYYVIVRDLENGRRRGFERVEFTGGEPTIRKDIFSLLEHARSLGFKEIGLSTNGRLFCYPNICKAFIKSGINRVNISLHGHFPKLHDAITRTRGSFEQTLNGIRNIKRNRDVLLEVNTVVSGINFRYLSEIGHYITDTLGIDTWVVTDLIPEGNALTLYNSLSVRLTDLSEMLSRLPAVIGERPHINFFDFPLCLFPLSMRKSKQFSFVIAEERDKIAEQVGYNPTRIKKMGGSYRDKYKISAHACRQCKFKLICGGIWKEYIDLYGKAETMRLAKKHGCLKES